MTNRFLAIAAVLAAPAIAVTSALAYCAMCRTSLVSSVEGQQLAGGINAGVLFLLGAPFLVVTAVSYLIFRSRAKLSVQSRRESAPGSLEFIHRSG